MRYFHFCCYPLMVSALFVFSSEAGAISIRYPASSIIESYKPYTLPNQTGEVYLSRLKTLPRGGTVGLQDLLSSQYSNWYYSSALDRLTGDFIVSEYTACGPTQLCGGGDLGLVGAGFDITYAAAPGEFQPSDGSNWVQRIRSNHSINGVHTGKLSEDSLDDSPSQEHPLYQSVYRNTSGRFTDSPARNDPYNPHTWIGELFLVETMGPKSNKEFIIYDGIGWGWGNKLKRQQNQCPANIAVTASGDCPTTAAMLGPNSPSSVNKVPAWRCPGDASCYGNYNRAFASSELIVSESTLLLDPSATSELDPPAVPTPALLPGMIATGIYHGRKWRKRKQRNQENDSDNIAA
jgi:hypothetical protein